MKVYVDHAFVRQASASPFTFQWDTTQLSYGTHWIYAVAYDGAGNYGSDGGYTVTTSNSPGGGGGKPSSIRETPLTFRRPSRA